MEMQPRPQLEFDFSPAPERCLAMKISGKEVIVVDIDFAHEPVKIVRDTSWSLQQGRRHTAYASMARRVRNFIEEREFSRVVVQGSEALRRAAQLKHMLSAEHRGVVIAAAAEVSDNVVVKRKSTVSRQFGERNTGDYVDADPFWSRNTTGELRKKAREAVLIAMATYEDE